MPFHNNGDSYLKKTKKIVVKKTQIILYVYISSRRCTKTRATSLKKKLKMLINIVRFINFFRSLHL